LEGFVKAGPNQGELRIHRGSYDPLQCSLASPAPGTDAKFRRWNVVLIAILAFIVLGAFVAAEAPRTARSTNAPLKENRNPAAFQHADSSKSEPPPIHTRSGSGNLNKEVSSNHHTG